MSFFALASQRMEWLGARQKVIAENVANADTPGDRGLEIPDFAETLRQPLMGQRATRATHLNGALQDGLPEPHTRRATVDPNGNTVSLETEMVTAVEASRAHNKALSIYRSNLTLLRASLGR